MCVVWVVSVCEREGTRGTDLRYPHRVLDHHLLRHVHVSVAQQVVETPVVAPFCHDAHIWLFRAREMLTFKAWRLRTSSQSSPRQPKGPTAAPKTPKGSKRDKEYITKLPINRPSGRYDIYIYIYIYIYICICCSHLVRWSHFVTLAFYII